MSRKKIVFVIVEGPSDEEALGVIFNRIYNSQAVYVQVMHGDITTELHVNSGNVVSKIGNIVKRYAGRTFKSADFSDIIHIVDMDGAYIPNEAIIGDTAAVKPIYSETEIRTQNKHGMEERNHRKQDCINRLASTSSIWNIPYRIFYMSCNFDHALYGKLNSTDSEKETDAFAFAKKYRDNTQGFLDYIGKSDFSVTGDYHQSWRYIREELHSLERHTNLGICFQKGRNS